MKQLELFEIGLLPAQHPKDRQGHKWNEVEEELLTQAIAAYQTPLEIASMLGRSEGAVKSRIRFLRLKPKTEIERKFEEAEACIQKKKLST